MKVEYQELVKQYKELCFEVGEDKEADRIPSLRDELVKKIEALTFKWIQDRCM